MKSINYLTMSILLKTLKKVLNTLIIFIKKKLMKFKKNKIKLLNKIKLKFKQIKLL
jgi:hypothetical protein